MNTRFKAFFSNARFLIKLPFILLLIVVGFIFEYIISLPLLILCELQNRFR